jgi:hypothetical protein
MRSARPLREIARQISAKMIEFLDRRQLPLAVAACAIVMAERPMKAPISMMRLGAAGDHEVEGSAAAPEFEAASPRWDSLGLQRVRSFPAAAAARSYARSGRTGCGGGCRPEMDIVELLGREEVCPKADLRVMVTCVASRSNEMSLRTIGADLPHTQASSVLRVP